MIAVMFTAWLLPVLIGIWLGMWQAKRPAMTPGELFKDLGTAILFAGCIIFLIQMVLVGALMMGLEGGMSGLGSASWRMTFLTAALWLPCLVIAYVVRAMKERRQR